MTTHDTPPALLCCLNYLILVWQSDLLLMRLYYLDCSKCCCLSSHSYTQHWTIITIMQGILLLH